MSSDHLSDVVRVPRSIWGLVLEIMSDGLESHSVEVSFPAEIAGAPLDVSGTLERLEAFPTGEVMCVVDFGNAGSATVAAAAVIDWSWQA